MMQRHYLLAIGLSMLGLSAAGAAHADEGAGDYPFPPLYGKVEAKGRVLVALRRLEKNCGYSDEERSGPSPEEERRCERAEKGLIALGQEIIGPALSKIDDRNLPAAARSHLYDAVGRIGDRAVAATLVDALGKLSQPGAENREWEYTEIESSLALMTFATLGDDSTKNASTSARDWKAWLAKHPVFDREQLVKERLDATRARLHDPDFWVALDYISFFADQELGREEGIAALGDLAARPDLDEEQLAAAKKKLREAQRALRADQVKKKSAAKSKPVPRPVDTEPSA